MKATIVAISVSLVLWAGSAGAQLETQTDGHHSALTTVDGDLVEDAVLARWFRELVLASDGKKRAKSAAFLFQASFGGGMLDDLRTSLTIPGIAFVGGAASRYDAPATGYVTTQENTSVEARPFDAPWVSESPVSAWTRELARFDATPPAGPRGELLENQTILAAINAAGSQSAAKAFDLGQSVATNGGSLVRLVDDTTKEHHAILWAGVPDRLRVFNDIANVRAALMQVWREETFSITVLFGDGVHKVLPAGAGGYNLPGDNNLPADWHAIEATAEHLRLSIQGLVAVMEPTDQVLFYATGHGAQAFDACGDTSCPKGRVTLAANGGDLAQVFRFSPHELATVVQRTKASPSLTLSYSGKVKRNAIVIAFNDESLGLLSPTESLMSLTVPQSSITDDNRLQVHSHNPAVIQLQARLLPNGSVGENPVRDCDANLVDDNVDLVTGADDINENHIPDVCESGRIRKPPKMHMGPERPEHTRPERPERPEKPVRPPRPNRRPGPSVFR